jgi:hypothetical protein
VTGVTEDRDQAGAELSAADEQVLRELTERARTGGRRRRAAGPPDQDGGRGPPWRASWMTISAMASTTPRAVIAAIPVTATARKQYSPRQARWRFPCRRTGFQFRAENRR